MTKYKNNDESISILINGLTRLKIENIEKEEVFVFKFPKSKTETFIYYNESEKGYSFEDMVKQSNRIGFPYLNTWYKQLIDLLQKVSNSIEIQGNELLNREDSDIKIENESGEVIEIKKMSRSNMMSFTKDKVSVTRIITNVFIAHLTNADLSMMNDFEMLKHKLDIVNKSFVTLGKPLVICDTNIVIRDTMLLTPAGDKKLESIGDLYSLKKIKLSKTQKEHMDVLLVENKDLFQEYAVKDALIVLKHANYMNDFNFKFKELGIPVTLSNLGKKFVLYK